MPHRETSESPGLGRQQYVHIVKAKQSIVCIHILIRPSRFFFDSPCYPFNRCVCGVLATCGVQYGNHEWPLHATFIAGCSTFAVCTLCCPPVQCALCPPSQCTLCALSLLGAPPLQCALCAVHLCRALCAVHLCTVQVYNVHAPLQCTVSFFALCTVFSTFALIALAMCNVHAPLQWNVICALCNVLSTLAVHSALYPVSSFSVHFIHLCCPMSAICIVLCAICIVHCARSVERMQGSPAEQADRQKHCASNPDLDAAKSFQLENKITGSEWSRFPQPTDASGCKSSQSNWKTSSQT